MPWATHSQLLTLAHISAQCNRKQPEVESNIMADEECWKDPFFAQITQGTLMMYQAQLQSVFELRLRTDKHFERHYGTEICPSRETWCEFIFLAQSAALLLWKVYRQWGIAPVFVDPTFGPYAPLALCEQLHSRCDQSTVLLALATLTAWQRDPFATSITVKDLVLPSVLLLFPHAALLTLHEHAPSSVDVIAERLRMFRNFNVDLIMQDIAQNPPCYDNLVDKPHVTAHAALVHLAGIESLYGVPSHQDRYDAHMAVLQHYLALVRPRLAERNRSIFPVITRLMTTGKLFDKHKNCIKGFVMEPLIPPAIKDRELLIQALAEKLQDTYYSNAAHYRQVEQLGKYTKGQYVLKTLRLAAAPPVFWSAPYKIRGSKV